MNFELTPASEDFVQRSIAAGIFQSHNEMLEEAIGLLKRRQELIAHAEEGSQQLRNGDFMEFDESGLRRYFDDVQTRGRERYEASRERS